MTPQEACNFPLDLENHYGYVYCVTFPSQKKYVGQSKRQWKYRWKNHHCSTSFCPAMKNALLKYKDGDLAWELLEYADDPQVLTARETFYIQKLNTLAPNGYNISLPGSACAFPEERKNRLRLGLALYHLHKTNPDATIEDAKQYIADRDYKNTHRVKKGTPEWIEQCKRVAQKRVQDKQEGKPASPRAEKRRLKRAQQPKQPKKVDTRAICIYETGERFESISAFCKKYNAPTSTAEFCLQKKNKCIHNMHIYPADISKKELDDYITFWYKPRQKQTGILTCVETGKTYTAAREVAAEQGVLKSLVYTAIKFNRPINGFHFTYATQETL